LSNAKVYEQVMLSFRLSGEADPHDAAKSPAERTGLKAAAHRLQDRIQRRATSRNERGTLDARCFEFPCEVAASVVLMAILIPARSS